MSTILKALDKRKRSSQVVVVNNASDFFWKAIILLALLVCGFMLFKLPMMQPYYSPGVVKQPATEVVSPTLPSIETSPVVNDNDLYEEKYSQVSEMEFETKPLPLIASKQLVISGEKMPPNARLNNEDSPLTVHHEPPLNTVSHNAVVSEPISETAVGMTDKVLANELEDISLEGVSEDLQARFARAIAFEDANSGGIEDDFKPQPVAASDISSMPMKFQFQVPLMSYDSHVYSSKEEERWIRINGVDLRVGERIENIELVDILPHQSVFRLGMQSFTLESLRDWKG